MKKAVKKPFAKGTFGSLDRGAAFRWKGEGHPVMEKTGAMTASVIDSPWKVDNIDPNREVEETVR